MIITLANGTELNLNTNIVTKVKTKVNSLPNGYILYQGSSVLDGAPIVVIATLKTSNEKTGNMVQTWIIRSDLSPVEAVQSKQDESICGMCPHRHNLKGACYVQPFQAPLAVYNSFKAGKYPLYDGVSLKDKSIRLGAYGDPAAVPLEVWTKILADCKNHTGYTHQISHKNFDKGIAEICMVSADTEKQATSAHKKGFKTFRVKTEKMPLLSNEINCLSESHGISCLECGLCDGQKQNIVINVHGRLNKRFSDKFERII